MGLPNEAIQEFQKIYKEKFSVVLTAEEAKIRAEGFLNLRLSITNKNKK